MTAEQDIAAIADQGENTAADMRQALTSVLARADGSAVVSGGTETDDGTYQYNAFTSDGTLEVETSGYVDVLVVGGGGGGGGYYSGGGGGGGAVVFRQRVWVDDDVAVRVGA